MAEPSSPPPLVYPYDFQHDRRMSARRLWRERMVRTWLGGILPAFAGLTLWLVSGASVAFRAALEETTGAEWPLIVLLYLLGVAGLLAVLTVPGSYFAGYALERRYGLSTQSRRGLVIDAAKSTAIGLATWLPLTVALYALLRWDPLWWWAPAALGALLLSLLSQVLYPVLILPRFFRQRPLEPGALREACAKLAAQAGAPAFSQIYVMEASAKTRRPNAMLAGWGRTRRILLFDTLLSGLAPKEIELVVAHELAHHRFRDALRGLLVAAAVQAVVLAALALILVAAWEPLGLESEADVAGLPLLALVGGALGLLLMPLSAATSRARERQADRFALDLVGDPAAAISLEKRLADLNLSHDAPPRWAVVWFGSHPPASERIAAAAAWRPRPAGRSGGP